MLEVSLGDDHPLLANALIDIAEAKIKQLLCLPDGEVGLAWIMHLKRWYMW